MDEKGYWQLDWTCENGQPPEFFVGSGVGEYSCRNLSAEQECFFVRKLVMDLVGMARWA